MRRAKQPAPSSTSSAESESTLEEDKHDEVLIAETIAFLESPEGQERTRFYRTEGCFPEMREYRDELMAQGHPKEVAGAVAHAEYLRRHGIEHKPEIDRRRVE